MAEREAACDWQHPSVVLEMVRVEANTPYVWVRWTRPDGVVRVARVHERDLQGR
jgi:hypothetical protein